MDQLRGESRHVGWGAQLTDPRSLLIQHVNIGRNAIYSRVTIVAGTLFLRAAILITLVIR